MSTFSLFYLYNFKFDSTLTLLDGLIVRNEKYLRRPRYSICIANDLPVTIEIITGFIEKNNKVKNCFLKRKKIH